MWLATQAGNNLVGVLWFGTPVADPRQRLPFLGEPLNRLFYLAEVWVRFNGHV
jgi:hypothetical protein